MVDQQCAVLKIASSFVLVHPGHHIGTAGHADRRCVVMIVKHHSLTGQLIQIRRHRPPASRSSPSNRCIGRRPSGRQDWDDRHSMRSPQGGRVGGRMRSARKLMVSQSGSVCVRLASNGRGRAVQESLAFHDLQHPACEASGGSGKSERLIHSLPVSSRHQNWIALHAGTY